MTTEHAPMTDEAAYAYLLQDGNLGVPCGRYGSDTQTCAPVAIALARIIEDGTGDPMDEDSLDAAMGLVVNSHDDVLSLIRDHGDDAQRELISEVLEDEYAEQAREQGRDAARAAATWAADGNTEPEQAAKVLAMIEDGDPQADDYLPARPNLSGEWADDPTPLSLYRDITGRDDSTGNLLSYETEHGRLVDLLADAFEEGVSEVFEDACVTELRKYV